MYLLTLHTGDDWNKNPETSIIGTFNFLKEAQETMYNSFIEKLKENDMDEQFFKQYIEEDIEKELNKEDNCYYAQIEEVEENKIILYELMNNSNFELIHFEPSSEIAWKLYALKAHIFFIKEPLSWQVLKVSDNILQTKIHLRKGKDAYSILGTCKDFPKLIAKLDDDDLKFINNVLLDYEIGKIDMLCNKDGKYVFAENNEIKFGGFRLTVLKWFEGLITTDDLIEELTTLPF